LKVMKERCLLCTCCISVCPNNGIDMTENEIIFNENCTECKICVKSCPVGAIE